VAEAFDERPVAKPPAVVVIGASTGGIEAISTILQSLPKDFPGPIIVVQHRTPTAGKGAIGVVLTGYGQNGTDGVQAIERRGRVVIAQDHETSRHFGRPRSAIALVRVAIARSHRGRI
jgi:chemotaxis response regulator CheB